MSSLTSIDLFAGVGGLTEGFRAAGFNTLFANEHDSSALAAFGANHPGAAVSGEAIQELDPIAIRESLGLKKGELSVLLGGPPCQGFSTYGKRDPGDPRNRLPEEYLRFLAALRPRAFVMENVVGLLSIQKGALLTHIQEVVTKLGYSNDVYVLNAVDYGVPQKRRRVFVVGFQDGIQPSIPAQTHFCETTINLNQEGLFDSESERRLPHLNVRDAISDLVLADPVAPKETQVSMPYPEVESLTSYQESMRNGSIELKHHSSKRMLGIRKLRLALLRPGDYGNTLRKRVRENGLPQDLVEQILDGGGSTRPIGECRKEDQEKDALLRQALHRGHQDLDEVLATIDHGGFANKYRRLKWSKPSHTLVAHMARDCSDFVHPDRDRFISVREAARLQSFPDSYCFPGSQFRQFLQIGNAVPPVLARAIAMMVVGKLSGNLVKAGI